MNKYAQQVTNDPDSQVYFYSGDIHVPDGDLTRISKEIDFLGDIHREKVYVNSASCSWVNPKELKDKGPIEWLKVPKK